MKFPFIAAERAHHSLSLLCRCLRVTRSGFYAWRRRPESAHAKRDRQLKVLVRASFDASKQRYGSPRIHRDLIEGQEPVSRKRVIRLMQEEGLKARVRKRVKLTTMSDHDQPVAANLLDRQFTAEAPNQRWVGDTTEFVIGEHGKLYLAAILDLFSRKVIGWAMDTSLESVLVEQAFHMAVQNRKLVEGLLHHTDRGSQYASGGYRKLLTGYDIQASMSNTGDCFDNAPMESFFSTLKCEQVHLQNYITRAEARTDIFAYIEGFYNRLRRHSSLGYLSPEEFERRYYDNLS